MSAETGRDRPTPFDDPASDDQVAVAPAVDGGETGGAPDTDYYGVEGRTTLYTDRDVVAIGSAHGEVTVTNGTFRVPAADAEKWLAVPGVRPARG